MREQVADYKIQFRAKEGVGLLYKLPLSYFPSFSRMQTHTHTLFGNLLENLLCFCCDIQQNRRSLFVLAAGPKPDATNNTPLSGVCV